MPPNRFSMYDPVNSQRNASNPDSILRPFEHGMPDPALVRQMQQAELAKSQADALMARNQAWAVEKLPDGYTRAPGGGLLINATDFLARQNAGLLPGEKWVDVRDKQANTDKTRVETELMPETARVTNDMLVQQALTEAALREPRANNLNASSDVSRANARVLNNTNSTVGEILARQAAEEAAAAAGPRRRRKPGELFNTIPVPPLMGGMPPIR
jgi:hypothetical protein